MKHFPQLHSRLNLLIVAGALTLPVALHADQNMYSPVHSNQSQQGGTLSYEMGGPGHSGTGTMDSGWSYSEGAVYDNLRRLQSSKSMTSASQGAQGPIRSDNSDPALWVYSESATYDNLRRLQSSTNMSPAPQGAQGPIRSDSLETGWSYEDGAAYDNLRRIQASQ